MHGGGVDRNRLLCGEVRPVLEVVVLPLLLSLEPQARQPPQVLLAHRLVHGRASPDALAVVVRDVGPPVCLGLDVAQNHVLNRNRHPGHLPRDVRLPAAPRLGEMLQNDLALVLFHALRHHVQNVMHHRCAQLQVIVALDALLRHRLGNPLAVPPFKLPREQVPQPPLKQRDHAAKEEQPHSPPRSPEPNARALAHRSGVEAVVNQMFQVLAHADLAHQPVLVAIHARELAHVREGVLQPVRKLEGVHVAKAELHVGVDDDLGQTQNLSAQVERIPEARLLALLRRESLDRLQVEVVVKMQVVEIFAMDEQVEHVVPLPAHLQPCLHPVDLRRLEKLRRAQNLEQVPLVQRLRVPVVQSVEHVALEQLLITDANLDRVVGGAVLLVPLLDECDIDTAARHARALVERIRRPVQRDAVGGVVRVQRRLLQQRLHLFRQLKIVVIRYQIDVRGGGARRFVGGNWVDERVEVEAGEVGVLCLDVHARRKVVHAHVHHAGSGVVKVGEGDAVLGADLLADDNFVDVVELVPVLLVDVVIAVQRLKFRTPRDREVQRFRGIERLEIKEVEVVAICQVREQLRREAVERAHDWHVETPACVRGAVDQLRPLQRSVPVIEPVQHRRVLVLVQLHLHGFQRLDIQQIIAIIERRLLIIEGRETHASEMATITLLPTHHNPHRAPLCNENGLDDFRDFVHKRDCSSQMVKNVDVSNLLPWHRHVLQQLQDRVRHIFQCPEVNALIVTELLARHISVILDDLSQMLWREILLLRLHISELPLIAVSLGLQRLPLSRLLFQDSLLVYNWRSSRRGGGSLWRHARWEMAHLLLLLLLLMLLLHESHRRHSWWHSWRISRRHCAGSIARGEPRRWRGRTRHVVHSSLPTKFDLKGPL
mmetsp:Transcript_67280/g.140138  ORF Transcript_67280/g.140138 Transcript_67280/m.140138 type:complete len:884 (+) Transcript_67280:4960-7611(+)